MQATLWTFTFLASGILFAFQIWRKVRILWSLRRDDGRNYDLSHWGSRLRNTLVYAFGQKKFFGYDQPSGIVHIIIFWGFLVLSLQVFTMFIRGWAFEFRLPGFTIEGLGGPYGFIKDVFELLVLVSAGMAIYRWKVSRPQRLMGFLPAEEKLHQQKHWEAVVILVFIMAIMISGLFYDAGRIVYLISDVEVQAEKSWQPVSLALASLLSPEFGKAISDISWWVHNIIVLCFMNLLPRSKHFHIITAIPNVFLGKIEAKGRLAKKDFAGDNPLFGRSILSHFTWKQALDMYSCTECGRCSSVCPATATHKPLAPRQLLLNLRDSLYANETSVVKGKSDSEVPLEVLVGENKAVLDEVIWSCVACRACEEACPVNIEYVDKIVDMRQHLVQEASRFPAELNRAFKGMETQSNPWGISPDDRANWALGLDVPMMSENPDVEYLYYVGCGGSFDAQNKKATQSFTRILKEAGVSFAILGKAEQCNGESARRLGNEYLFQSMAGALVGTLQAHKIKKIIVNCPHCFNTLKNEYPDFGGNWEVVHAAALVNRLEKEGRIQIKGELNKNIVYHDSCYYGRFNDIYDEPRNLLNQVKGARVCEMTQCKNHGTCCGAGGGRMWMEEKADQRVNIYRTEQALEKKPDVIATSCPFCRIMIGSGVNEKGLSDKVQVMDVMEIVANNLG